MAKNIEMNTLEENGSYEVVYPMTKQELVIDLLNDDVKELMGLDSNATASDAFKTAYLSSVLDGKAMVEITFTDSITGKPMENILITCSAFCDSAGTPMSSYTTNSNGKIIGFVNAINPTISISGYADIQDFSQALNIPALGKQYVFNYQLTTLDFKKFTTSSSTKFSGNVNRVDVTVVGGGGAGATGNTRGSGWGSPSSYIYGIPGGGGGYCTVKENASFIIDTSYSVTVGAGGVVNSISGAPYCTSGGNGGASSFLDVSANGGMGGQFNGYDSSDTHSGGAGNGRGGNGVKRDTRYPTSAGNGQAGVAGSVAGYSSFTETVLYGGGGGSGAMNQGTGGAGAGYGGAGGSYSYNVEDENGKAGTNGYGGGGGGAHTDLSLTNDDNDWYSAYSGVAGAGGSGCVAIRMHLKSRQ